jgi:hypothetical protein
MTGHQHGRRAPAEHQAVPLLVGGVHEVEPAQQRIARDFGGAQQIAAAVELRLSEPE